MPERDCLNCGSRLPSDAKYCNQCGQSLKEVTLSLKQILKDGLTSLFNWDSRLFHTLRDLYKPHKLTRAYVEGKRRYYVSPARLFIFSLLSIFSIFFLTSGKNVNENLNVDFRKEAIKMDLSYKYDTIVKNSINVSNDSIHDNIKKALFGELSIEDDTINFNIPWLNVYLSKYNIMLSDILLKPMDEIIENCKIERFSEKLFLNQLAHFLKDSSGGIRFIIQNISYAILLVVFFAAFLLKILYIRKPYYFVEHLVIVFYSHTLAIFFFVPIILESWVKGDATIVSVSGLLILVCIQYYAMKQYYKQGRFMTLAKQILYNLGYFVILLSCIAFISLVSLILF